MSQFKYNLGDKVKDKITGYTGIIICRSEWLYGCIRYVIQAQELKDGKPVDNLGVDQDQIDLVEETMPQPMRATGGPKDAPTRQANPTRR